MTTPPVAPLPVHGTVPLRARWEQWMQELVENPQEVSALTSRYGSPVNVLNPAPLCPRATRRRCFARRENSGIFRPQSQ